MSILSNTRRSGRKTSRPSPSEARPTATRPRFAEAPDRGDHTGPGLESPETRDVEAPDAGEAVIDPGHF